MEQEAANLTESSIHHPPLPQPVPLLLRSPSLSPVPQDLPNPPSGSLLEQRRLTLRESHAAAEEWYLLYEQLMLGVIPSPEQSQHAPPSQQLLAAIPLMKTSRKNSIIGHFFASHSDTTYQCQTVMESGSICGQLYKKTGSTQSPKKHIINTHGPMHDALKEFRYYQCMVQGIELPVEEKDETSTMPKMTRFEESQVELSNHLEQPLPCEQTEFQTYVLKLMAVRGMTFDILGSDVLRNTIAHAHPGFKVPGTSSLQPMLHDIVQAKRIALIEYIHRNVGQGAITADCWTSADRRRFLEQRFIL
ncbi:hypothetical protein BGZ98_004289 [Dissophora globulifera]|nr:hypothetical protein BGZ98_004289 [Dissophora globulifera]